MASPMTQFNFTYDPNVSLEQRLGFEMAAAIWSKFLTDDVTLNLHIGATTGLNDNQAVGGAVPIFHEVNYGVYQQYLQQDATSAQDAMVVDALQEGNTVDFLIDTDGDPTTASELVDGNTTIMITRAQAKALGMEKALELNNGSTLNRDVLADPTALDGYIVINNSYNWGYDLTRQAAAAPDTLDFLTMALHEIG
ncbi:MAG: NF038122 family metalloprotease, partial [Prochlorotrichaceae cyanobacterium]